MTSLALSFIALAASIIFNILGAGTFYDKSTDFLEIQEAYKSNITLLIGCFLFVFLMSVLIRSSIFSRFIWLLSLVSIAGYIITHFAIIYAGSNLAGNDVMSHDDYLYFSIVTFTTLGYGDFQPVEGMRIYSAAQAILGFTFVPMLISELVAITNDIRARS